MKVKFNISMLFIILLSMMSETIVASDAVYDIKVVVKGSGSVVCNNSYTVESHDRKDFTLKNNADVNLIFAPMKGYKLEKLTICGIDRTKDVKNMQLTLSDIHKNTIIVATFEPETDNNVKLTLIASGKGDLYYDGNIISDTRKVVYVKEGTNIRLNIGTEKDSQLGKLTVNGVSKNILDNSYSFTIQQNTVVKASFETIVVKVVNEEKKEPNFSLGVTGPGSVGFNAKEINGQVAGDAKDKYRENKEKFYIPKEYPVTLSIVPVDNLKQFVIGYRDLTETVKGSDGKYTIGSPQDVYASIEFIQRYKVSISLQGQGAYEAKGDLKEVKGKGYYLVNEMLDGHLWIKVKKHYHITSVTVNGVNRISEVYPSNTIADGFWTYDFYLKKIERDQKIVITIDPDPILTISCGTGGTADRALSINDPTGYNHNQDPEYRINSNETVLFYEPSAASGSLFNGKPWILRMYAKEGMKLSKVTVNSVDKTSQVTRSYVTRGTVSLEMSYLNLGIINNDTKVAIYFSAVTKVQDSPWVDLGTGMLWAKCNVGAASPENAGKYYTWDQAMKLNVQKGRLPTREEVRTLISQCRHEIDTLNGVKGMRFYHRSDRSISIFLPAAGMYPENDPNKLTEVGREGAVWTDTRSGVKEKISDAYEQHSTNPLWLILGDTFGDFDRAALAYSVAEDDVQCLNADKGARINVRLVLDKGYDK